jgi:hypothetical protein
MAFKDLDVQELARVAQFFAADVAVANPNKGPTKKELLAGLAAGEEPVTWDQYNDIYLPTAQQYKLDQPAPEEEEALPEPPRVTAPEPAAADEVILCMERENGRFDAYGHTFTKEHPFRPVTPEVAALITRQYDGFRIALPQEVAEYYDRVWFRIKDQERYTWMSDKMKESLPLIVREETILQKFDGDGSDPNQEVERIHIVDGNIISVSKIENGEVVSTESFDDSQ